MTAIDCSYSKCSAWVELIIEQEGPEDDERTINRIPMHMTEPDSWFGQCPASLTHYPSTAAEHEMLRAQARVHEHIASSRDNIPPTPAAGEQPRHAKAPQPSKDPYWFRPSEGDPDEPNNGGQNVRAGSIGPRAHRPEPLRYLPDTGPKGGSVTSAAEVKGAILSANDAAARAQEMIRQAAGVLAEARALVDWIRGTNPANPLGGPSLDAADDELTEAMTLIGQGIQANTEYGSTL